MFLTPSHAIYHTLLFLDSSAIECECSEIGIEIAVNRTLFVIHIEDP
jgi:hypothetical protein